MNTNQAKNINLPDLLSRLGFQPVEVRKGGKELWYLSPFRAEKAPSLHVSEGHSVPYVWKDFGDIGGTVIDFVMRYKSFNHISDALAFLDGIYGKSLPVAKARVGEKFPDTQPELFSFHQQAAAQRPENFLDTPAQELELLSADPVTNRIILAYLIEKRAISSGLITRYLKEIRYKHLPTGKEYFAFGMPNQAGGYEVRSASDDYIFKSVLGGRDISYVRGTGPAPRAVNVFEGMTDFLSLLEMMGAEQSRGDVIVMHSLSSFTRVCEFIRKEDYTTINTFLDNDRAGQQHTEQFIQEFGVIVQPQNALYQGYKDLNEALIDNQVPPSLKR